MNEIIFITLYLCLGMTIYSYIGYPFILWLWSVNRKSDLPDESFQPPVTIIISAYNEQDTIAPVIRAINQSDYPSQCIDVIVVSESTDRTNEIVRAFESSHVRLKIMPERVGKVVAQTLALQEVTTAIVVFMDGNCLLTPDSLRFLISPLSDPRVGAVSGAKHITATGSAASKGDGLYWRYETALKSLESKTGSCWSGCEGTLMAIRRNLVDTTGFECLAEDTALCYRLAENGIRHIYEPRAVFSESTSKNIQAEFSRKIRIVARNIRALYMFKHLLNPFRRPGFTFQNIAHRLLRWSVPFFLIVIFLTSALPQSPWVRVLFFGQILFYSIAFFGWTLKRQQRGASIPIWMAVPLYFTAMNVAALCGWLNTYRQVEFWAKTPREACREA